MDEIKRLHYFDHQFLRERDFSDEQKYHMTMRRLHNERLHTWGIAEGLQLTCPVGGAQAKVRPGVAIDGAGNEIVLAVETETPDLEGLGYNPVWITIRYGEEETDRDESTGATGNTRVLERPEIEVSKDPPGDASVSLILGRVELDNEGKLTGKVDEGLRRPAGVMGGNLDARSLTLEVPDTVSGEWPVLRAPSASRAELAGSLTVTDSVGIGTDAPTSKLSVSGGTAIGAGYTGKEAPGDGLLVERTVGIGTDKPSANLSVSGNAAIGTRYAGEEAPANGLVVQGSVGIGTGEPRGPLHVAGDIALGDDGDGQRFILHLRGEGSNTLQITCDDPEGNWDWGKGIFFQRDTGNVGIGSGDPKSQLDVAGDTDLKGNLTVRGALQANGGLSVAQGKDTELGGKLSVSGGATIGAGYASTKAPENGLLVEGKVGVGPQNPGCWVDVQRNDATAPLINAHNRDGSHPEDPLSPRGVAGTTYEGTAIHGYVYTGAKAGAGVYGRGNGNAHGVFALATGDGGVSALLRHGKGAAGQALRVESGRSYFRDSVGIGTDAPKAPLHVAGDLALGRDENNKRFVVHTRGASAEWLQLTCDGADGKWDWRKGIFFRRDTGNVGIGENGYAARSRLSVSGGTAIGAGYLGTEAPANGLIVEGKVGIGTQDPEAPLDVKPEVAKARVDKRFSYTTCEGTTQYTSPLPYPYTTSWSQGAPFAAFFRGVVRVFELWAEQDYYKTSDRRIKAIEGQRDPLADLERVNRLKVSDFSFLDKVGQGDRVQTGFVSQEVEQVVPQAVSRRTSFIPDIYRHADRLERDAATGELTIGLAGDHGLAAGDRVKLIGEGGEFLREVVRVVSPTGFVVGDCEGHQGEVFVYGKEVDDFQTLSYDQVFAVAVSALQGLTQVVDRISGEHAQLREEVQRLSAVAGHSHSAAAAG